MTRSVILSATRTPVGGFQGSLSTISATKLGSIAIAEAIKKSKISPKEIEHCIMGCVLPAGLGQAPARQAALKAGLPNSVEALTINKVCGSGLMSVMIADLLIRSGDQKIVVCGGMESMSNSPYLLTKARSGYRMGNAEMIDSMIKDGLWDADTDQHMGSCADMCGREKKISREDQDKFASQSYRNAIAATEKGLFKDEIVPVPVPQKKGEDIIVDRDEGPFKVDFDKMLKLKPSFNKDGSVTAANASSINDGAAALVVVAEDHAKKIKASPLATIVAHAGHSQESKWFTTAPVEAVKKLLAKTGVRIEDIDLFEINEAFSCVTLHAIRELKINPSRVNVNGGAAAIGHPIGASGARILVTLLHAMKQRKARLGLATLCIGGGEAVAMLLEKNNH